MSDEGGNEGNVELTLWQVGEFVVILRKHPSGWWEGCSTRDGRRGWIPSNHVEEIDAQVNELLLSRAVF